MSIGPIIQDSVRPIWTFTLLLDDNRAFDLTGATFTGVLYSRDTTHDRIMTPGNFTVTGAAAAGVFTYAPVPVDVAEAGEWEIEMTITISNNSTVVRDHVSIQERYGP